MYTIFSDTFNFWNEFNQQIAYKLSDSFNFGRLLNKPVKDISDAKIKKINIIVDDFNKNIDKYKKLFINQNL